MLGSLAKCLRIMGYDTIYKSNYKENELLGLSETGRIILTKIGKHIPPAPTPY